MARQRNEQAQLLADVRLFEGLDANGLIGATVPARRVQRERDSSFFRQGQEAKSFFVVIDGRVKVSQVTPEGHQIVVRYAGSGEMFGCVPLYGGKEYPATATAVTRCEALAWDRPAVDRLMERYPRIAINALELLGEELTQVRSRYQELATERVERRVARALLRLVSQAGKKVKGGVLIEFPLSRQDLAELTGTTLHTVSRILSGWQQMGIIESGRRRIVIRKPHGLVSIAEDLDAGDSGTS
ncbi:MAG: Crp/Fnr family transcriptional regulator [Acidobacteriota bacterium]